MRILASSFGRKATILFRRSLRIVYVEWTPGAHGILSVVAFNNDRPWGCRKSTELYGEVFVVRCTCVLYA